jgi:aryl-alcohol dehydrogenase-like predicted oxidoreductase
MRDNVELTYKKLFEDKKLGSTVWSPLASGILTGKYNDGIPEDSRFGKNPNLANFMNKYFSAAKKEKTIASLRKFQELAIEMDCSMAQLAMAWVISNPDVSTAITGVTRVEQII